MSAPVSSEPHAADRLRHVSAPSLSLQLWGVDWSQVLPFASGELGVELSSYERASAFVAAHYRAIFCEDERSPFSNSELSQAKARYYALADFFEVRRGGETVGLIVCNPSDWSTYYVRSAALLPEWQGHGVIQRFFAQVMFDLLRRVGVERVELDVAPSNFAMMHVAARLRFNASGTLLSDRWGALTRFTKYLAEQPERTFVRQFCSGPRYPLASGARMQTPSHQPWPHYTGKEDA